MFNLRSKKLCMAVLTSSSVLWIAEAAPSKAEAVPEPVNRIVINEDASHYFLSRGVDGATREKLLELTANYCRGMVGEVIYNISEQRTNIAGTVLDPIWKGCEFRGGICYFRGKDVNHYGEDKWIACAKLLSERGIDPYAVWLEETRKKGRKAVLSFRMNDTHYADDTDNVLHNDLWRDNPAYRIDFSSGYSAWECKSLDYSQPEVRNLYLTYIRQILERYDCDGIELDWMRFGHHFAYGKKDRGREILTQFHREVRQAADQAAKRLGHPVTVSARIPADPVEAFAMGYDVARWSKEKLVQSVVVTPFLIDDTDMPIGLWRSILGDEIGIAAGLELNILPYPGSDGIKENAAFLAGQAANYLWQGADKIYLFNMMDSVTCLPDPEQYILALNTIGSLEKAAASHRRHPVTYQDTWAFGHYNGQTLLPLSLPWYEYRLFRISIGPKPQKNQRAHFVLGYSAAEQYPVRVWINNREVTELDVFENNSEEKHYPKSSKYIAVYDCEDVLVDGANNIVIQRAPEKSNEAMAVTWVEIEILN